jgi:hypothetical protein
VQDQALKHSQSPSPSHAAEHATGIPAPVRASMEAALGADLSDVRVRTSSADALRLGAAAFTRGHEIQVAPGHWAPHTRAGRELLGHELAHVLQQREGRVRPTVRMGDVPVSADAALEREADVLGARAARGEHAARGQHAALSTHTAQGKHAAGSKRAADGLARGRGISPAAGVVQRQGPHGPVPTPADQVIAAINPAGGPVVAAPDFPAAFRILGGLPTADLLATLTEVQSRGSLNLLIANAPAIPPPLDSAVLTTAMTIVQQSHGPGANLATANATVAASGLPAAVTGAMTTYLLGLRPAVPAAHGADLRVAPHGPAPVVPDASLARELGYELDPSSRPAPAPPPPPAPVGVPAPPPPPPPARIPWDGKGATPAALAAQATMQGELFNAYDAYLTFFRANTLAALARPRVAFPAGGGGGAGATGVVDIANQARAVLEARYAVSMDAASSTAGQVAGRAPRSGVPGPGKNIFDASSEPDRVTFTATPDLAPGVAWWLFQNDTPGAAGAAGARQFATDILAAHHYASEDDPHEAFRWQVANAYAAANTLAPSNSRQLIDYRITGWSERAGSGITLLSSFDPGANAQRAELAQRWRTFQAAVHESLHLRTHPVFTTAAQGRGAMEEGFTEMFAVSTLNTSVMPDVRAGTREPLRHVVEGVLAPAHPDPALAANRTTPTQYRDHRAEAERIRDGGHPVGGIPHTGIGEPGVRAAYFEGHVEYLGLAPDGSALPGLRVAGTKVQVRIPGSIAGLDDLARRSGVPRATIEHDNPGITNVLPASAVLAKAREHVVVTGETRALIAAQHGVSEADLVRANPDIATDIVTNNWPVLAAGTKILIPAH